MKVHTDFLQCSDRWREMHLGRPTASEFKKIITPAKGEFSAQHKALAYRLAAERITGGFEDIKEIFDPHIQRGIAHEPRALASYQYQTGAFARSVGFVESDDKRSGCSPDALVYDSEDAPYENPIGGIEFKCPTLSRLMEWSDEGILPLDHKCQVHGCLAITGLPWWDFVAFNAEVPEKLFTVRVVPDKFTESLKTALTRFLDIVDDVESKFKTRGS